MPGSTFTSPSTEAGTEPGTTALTVITEEAGTSTILTKGTGAGRCLLFFVFLTRATGTGTVDEPGESIQSSTSMVISGEIGTVEERTTARAGTGPTSAATLTSGTDEAVASLILTK